MQQPPYVYDSSNDACGACPSYFVGLLHSGDVTKCLLVFVPLSNVEDPTKCFFLFRRKLKAIVFAE